ncbi:MAG: hypothetical protein GY771_13550 [bacterium]|nr:hypothetical protein [bacterium]
MNNPTLRKISNFLAENLFYIIIVPLTGYLIYYAIATLQWRMYHDSTAFMYCAYLINDLGYIPYRDIFEVQMPGTFIIFSIIGWASDYSDIGYRVADIIYLIIIMVSTWLLLRKVDRRVAFAAPVIFGILYLGEGPKMSLEREYLMLPFIVSGVFFAISSERLRFFLRAFLIGLSFGFASLIKPHSLIGLPVVLSYSFLVSRDQMNNRLLEGTVSLLSVICGLSIPWIIVLIYLWSNGGLPSFLDIVFNYIPLYRGIGSGGRFVTGLEAVKYYLFHFRTFGSYGVWVILAVLSTVFSFAIFKYDNRDKYIIYLFVALAVVFYVYPAISGQFFFYHWSPFVYFTVILASLSVLKTSQNLPARVRMLPVFILLLACVISIRLPFGGFRNIYGDSEIEEPWGGTADEIGQYLNENMKPGDKVQPLGWIHGTEHGLLIARAEPATKHIYDFDFYHNISEDYIQRLRSDFIEDLHEEKPRFIVEVPMETLIRCSGPDTTTEFPKLREFIENEYIEVASGEGYIIYEREEAGK